MKLLRSSKTFSCSFNSKLLNPPWAHKACRARSACIANTSLVPLPSIANAGCVPALKIFKLATNCSKNTGNPSSPLNARSTIACDDNACTSNCNDASLTPSAVATFANGATALSKAAGCMTTCGYTLIKRRSAFKVAKSSSSECAAVSVSTCSILAYPSFQAR